jgi:hypothetical protein
MKKWIKSLVIPVVASGIVVPISVQAQTNENVPMNQHEWKQEGQEGRHHYKFEYIENQEKNLVKLSAQYSPDLTPTFNQVFKVRKDLFSLYREDPEVKKHFEQKRIEFKAKREEFQTKYKSQLEDIQNNLRSGNITKQEAMQKRFELWKQFVGTDPAMQEKLKNFKVHKDLHIQLEKAVETKDRVKINSVLHQILKAEQNRNDYLKSEINKIKNV